MEITLFLAKFIGVGQIIVGLSGLIGRPRFRKMLDEMGKSAYLLHLTGLLIFLFGLLVVLFHNVWNDLTTVLISLIGWVALYRRSWNTYHSRKLTHSLFKKIW